ncbi:NAD(P)-dependent oxidoreductase [Paenibacillus sp. RRE4]|uniref:NAD(P)-dependent oxidoreductase n=1 Tax=Paenibacillus sp. RRE4 TaxID=2962587 RepID=UPI002881BB51|nr:NAD(P)-dependent oxidoreductase [Paenibacillus sp. RRE4]MDT0124322.1 NAD(P)-dependent oxidoreductase [Paenibacillus sp. RRE4]
MNEVTVIGLGAMGGAIAQTLLEKGYQVTVWNRTATKADSIVEKGAVLTSTAAEAIRASQISIICVSDYKTSYEVLDVEGVHAALSGRVLIQLTTGSPEQAQKQEIWANTHGASYIDGAIAAAPPQIGGAHATIFTSGSMEAFDQVKPVLGALAGHVPYYGEQVSAAASIDLAFLSYLFGSYLGFFHASRILESDGLRIDDFGSMIAGVSPMVGSILQYEGEVIQHSKYENPQSSLQMSMVTVGLLMEQAREKNMNNEFPLFLQNLFRKAIDAGYGEQDIASLVKTMR